MFIKKLITLPLYAIVFLPLIGLVSCGSGASGAGGTSVQIDWVNFIRFQGITYLADSQHIAPTLLGPKFAQVKFELEGNVNDPNYHSKDGDAAFLNPGTTVYTVKGYRSTFRLAVYQDGSRVLFEADTNPMAKHGSDLVDIAGKVRSIGVNSAQNGTLQLGAIKDPREVTSLVNMVLSAPVNQQFISSAGTRYVVVFYLNDGTTLSRMFWLKSGELSRGIMLSGAFGIAIQQAAVK
ncbi:MAG: hypothetical protein ACYDER_13925 [Ktedonobacteraceae bacterium]